MAQWRIWIGPLETRDEIIIVPAELRQWGDNDDLDTDPHVRQWNIGEQVRPGEMAGKTTQQAIQAIKDKLIAKADPYVSQFDLWQAINGLGSQYLPGWPE